MACIHSHDCSEHECATEWSLFRFVDVPKVWALNEAVDGSVQSIFKSWDRRLEFSVDFLRSNDDDPELLVVIPFTNDVKIKGISVIGGPDGTSPSKMRAFVNRTDIDFTNAQDLKPVQEWELAENLLGELEYTTRYFRFQGVASLTLHFPTSFGGCNSQIHYIGLRGEGTNLKRDAVATTVYEARPNPLDHKTPADELTPQIL